MCRFVTVKFGHFGEEMSLLDMRNQGRLQDFKLECEYFKYGFFLLQYCIY